VTFPGKAELGDDAAIAILYRHVGLDLDPGTDEMSGQVKPHLLVSLKKMAAQQSRGAAGWAGYLEQMDLVAESLAQATYLRSASSQPLVNQIKEDAPGKPHYGNIVGALTNVAAAKAAQPHLAVLHELRCNRTNAHRGDGIGLDQATVTGVGPHVCLGGRRR